MKRRRVLGLAALVILLVCPAQAVEQRVLKPEKTVNLSLLAPRGLSWRKGSLYLVDQRRSTLYRFNGRTFGLQATFLIQSPEPWGVVWDDGRFWVSDERMGTISVYDGESLERIARYKTRYRSVLGIALAKRYIYYVADNTVVKASRDDPTLVLAGQTWPFDGTPPAIRSRRPKPFLTGLSLCGDALLVCAAQLRSRPSFLFWLDAETLGVKAVAPINSPGPEGICCSENGSVFISFSKGRSKRITSFAVSKVPQARPPGKTAPPLLRRLLLIRPSGSEDRAVFPIARVQWLPVAGARSYRVEYRILGKQSVVRGLKRTWVELSTSDPLVWNKWSRGKIEFNVLAIGKAGKLLSQTGWTQMRLKPVSRETLWQRIISLEDKIDFLLGAIRRLKASHEAEGLSSSGPGR